MAFRSLKLLLHTHFLAYTTQASSPQMAFGNLRLSMRRFASNHRRPLSSSLHPLNSSILSLRAGGEGAKEMGANTQLRSSSSNSETTKYVTLAQPAPGSRKGFYFG